MLNILEVWIDFDNFEIFLGEYWLEDVVQLEHATAASGGPPTPANAFTINGHPGPNYNCSNTGNVGNVI